MRTLRMLFLLMCASATAFAVRADVCSSSTPGGNVINMVAFEGEATYVLTNPIKSKPPADPKAIRVAWLTDAEFMGTSSSADIGPQNKPFPFALGYCGPDPGDATKAVSKYFRPGDADFSPLATAEAILIHFSPSDTGTFTRYLRLFWTPPATQVANPQPGAQPPSATEEKATYRINGTAGAPDYASDARYKLWGYTGYTYLRSQKDFKDGFAEFLARTEIRWIDTRIAMKHYHPEVYEQVLRTGLRCDRRDPSTGVDTWDAHGCRGPGFFVTRIYGEMGLTGTTVVASNNTGDTQLGKAAQAFGGAIGVGFGQTRLVATLQPSDTSAFSVLGVVRLGMISIPGVEADTAKGIDAVDSRSAFFYSTNLRIENEPAFRDDGVKSGNFEGAYFEIGWGESEQFSRKKYPRLRFDGLVPINGGSNLFRFAGRLQIDAPRPFARKKDGSDNLANEIRLSILFNIDLLELGRRMSGGK